MGTCDTHGRDEKYKILIGKSEGKRSLEDLGVGGRIILKWMLGKECVTL
jgi:hypothetical protein